MLFNHIRTRAYFHWLNKSGSEPLSSISNWLDSEREEQFLSSLPKQPVWDFSILDQNCLRDESVILSIPGNILIPDFEIAEMVKGNGWCIAASRSLSLISQKPERIYVSKPSGEILHAELSTGHNAHDIIDEIATKGFRKVLAAIANGKKNEVFQSMASFVKEANDDARCGRFNDGMNRNMMNAMVKAWREELTEPELKGLRKGNFETNGFKKLLSAKSMTKTIVGAYSFDDYSIDHINALAIFPSFSACYMIALSALALEWIAKGGFDQVKAERITNDLIDIEFIATSIFCQSLFSKENRVNSLRSIRNVSIILRQNFKLI